MLTRKLFFLNGLAALGVVIHHANAYGLQAMFFWTDRYLPVTVPNYDQVTSLAYYLTMMIRQLVPFAVPAFLFISGFFIAFMARSQNANVTWKMVLPRIKVLLVPFFVWTAIRYTLLRQIPSSIGEILDPYYFIPLLIQFYLISPLLVPFAKARWKMLLFGAGFLHLAFQTVSYLGVLGVTFPGQGVLDSFTPRWLILGQQPFWFPLGLVAGLHLQQFQTWLFKWKKVLLVGTIVFGAMAFLEYQLVESINGASKVSFTFGGYTRTLFTFSFILWFLTSNENAIPFTSAISKISARSLGIYLGNIPVIYVFALLMYHFAPQMLGNQFFYQMTLVVAGLFVPLLLMEAVRISPARQLYRYVFG